MGIWPSAEESVSRARTRTRTRTCRSRLSLLTTQLDRVELFSDGIFFCADVERTGGSAMERDHPDRVGVCVDGSGAARRLRARGRTKQGAPRHSAVAARRRRLLPRADHPAHRRRDAEEGGRARRARRHRASRALRRRPVRAAPPAALGAARPRAVHRRRHPHPHRRHARGRAARPLRPLYRARVCHRGGAVQDGEPLLLLHLADDMQADQRRASRSVGPRRPKPESTAVADVAIRRSAHYY